MQGKVNMEQPAMIINLRGPKIMNSLWRICLLLVAMSAQAGDGLVSIKSAHDVKKTMDRLETIVREKDMKVFIRIDHQEGAKQTGEILRPTQLLIFGNPKAGTPLMQCDQSVAIDLPQKALVWEDEDAQVWLSYNDPHYLARRHEISECREVLDKISRALNSFAEAATTP
jgi:uncharacterized protein (DUF302 family)